MPSLAEQSSIMNVDEVKQTIRRGNRAAGAAQATMAAVGDHVDQTRLTAKVTHDSEHSAVKIGRERLREAASEVRQVFELLATGVQAAEKFERDLG